MKTEDKKVFKESRKSPITIIMYIAALIVAIAGVTLLVNNIILFRDTVNQYVAQGYEYSMVTGQLIPSQLVPNVCESVAIYGGIAFALLGVAEINEKTSKCLMIIRKDSDCNDVVEEGILLQEGNLDENADNIVNARITEEEVILEEVVQESEKSIEV
ncbi:hypothetical protein JOC70_003689 [Clostridium pascui]|uniref:hypothetical protein n=1 Tax=Clostridium pascui TaxID=46609 RepID=UPI00195B5214|nr:hypothetical protein [Clostridium pascui]MBM7872140.1 hypothetical protein [Clostridium pascui]